MQCSASSLLFDIPSYNVFSCRVEYIVLHRACVADLVDVFATRVLQTSSSTFAGFSSAHAVDAPSRLAGGAWAAAGAS